MNMRGLTSNAFGSRGDYVLRAEPSSSKQGFWAEMNSLGQLVRSTSQVLHRDHSWTVRVRRRQEDPFGDVVVQQTVESRRAAKALLRSWSASLLKGESPETLASDA